LAKRKVRLQGVGLCKSCNIEVINTDLFVIFADRTCQHTTCYEQSETIRQNNLKEKPVANQDSEKRMQMYIDYLKTKKCRHKYQTE
jgi:hypothetical protein